METDLERWYELNQKAKQQSNTNYIAFPKQNVPSKLDLFSLNDPLFPI
tara:strand:- start:235 stop:378 length:144 start_codon:yes stop_codon:yes gene_type:complete